VQATPGSRIDGMGMQAHYFCEDTNPTMEAVKKAATDYGKLVDQVQFTEIDFKGSTGPKDEQLAKRYKDLYDTVRRLINEGTNVTGFTIWGVVDKHSWLQQQNSAGGGATGTSKQYPLLFDNNYKAKPSFYALCNAGELEPEIKHISLIQLIGDDFTTGETYSFETENGKVEFTPMWDATGVKVKVNVTDATVDDTDAVSVYVAADSIKKATVSRSEAKATADGYEAILAMALDTDTATIKFDITATDGDKTFAFNDTKLNQDESSKFYASALKKPLLAVVKGTVNVDGLGDDAAWEKAERVPLTINLGADVTANAKLLWDEEYLYVLMDVTDAVLNSDAKDEYQQDSIEVFIDENNEKSSGYQDDDKQYRVNYKNLHSFNGTKCNEDNIISAAVLTEEGYIVEAAFKWTDIQAKAGTKVGLELQVNDANATGKRSGTLSWSDNSGNAWSAPEVFGTILLVNGEDPKPVVKNGVVEEDGKFYYYNNGKKAHRIGLVEWEGNYYYVLDRGTLATGFVGVTNTHGLLDMGTYEFGEDGKMIIKNGFVEENGKTYYYVNGRRGYAGLIEVDGSLYYVKGTGEIAKGRYYISNTNGLLPRKDHAIFDTDGKFLRYGKK
ncbi:MAG: endo-1,4-beta-xylanase, partial [Lachnospiraceae bacterium]|nr:endo-1,4-beta-xylanase [Lachnospiraceae bacterium]